LYLTIKNNNKMENIKKLYINEDGTPLYTHYNGNWNIMKMETTDGCDYSLTIDEMINESLYHYEEEEGVELKGQEYIDFVKTELQYYAECFGFELVEASWFDKKDAEFNYLHEQMMNTPTLLDYIFHQGEKPHFTTIWKEVSDMRNSYTMEKIRGIVMGYNDTEQLTFCLDKTKKFNEKVEKMKDLVESNQVGKLWEIFED